MMPLRRLQVCLNSQKSAASIPLTLARHFRRHYRSTIGEYLRQRRVDAAMEMLVEKEIPLTEVALEFGFSSHGHLCTVFKRLTGMTPSEFREIKHQKNVTHRDESIDRFSAKMQLTHHDESRFSGALFPETH